MKTRTSISAAFAIAFTISAPCLAQESVARVRATTITSISEKASERGSVIPANRADYNHSGTVDSYDIFDFLTGWFANSPDADINGNGILEGLDVLEFINIWMTAPTASVTSVAPAGKAG